MQKKASFQLNILFLLFLAPTYLIAEEFIIPIYDHHQPPLVLFNQGEASGIYIDLFREILIRANIESTFVVVPKKRARMMFEEGDSLISCCDNPAWRTRPKEQKVQLFSFAFYNTKDIFIFPKGKKFSIDDLSSLTTKSVAVIRGYGYRGSEWFGERNDFGGEYDLLKFISLGRADVGIVNHDVAKRWVLENGSKIELGSYHDIASLHVRVHRKRQNLLPNINQAISSIISDGTREEIIGRYLSSPTD